MNWYLAKLTYRIICGAGNHTPQFDEQLRLVSGNDEVEALRKAKAIGESGADIFFNNQHQMVQWQFVNITELYSISEWMDGVEICSSIKEADNADAYINFVTSKAASLDHRYLSMII